MKFILRCYYTGVIGDGKFVVSLLTNSYTKFHITIFGVFVRYCRHTTSWQCLSYDSADILLYTQRSVVTNVEYFLEVFDVSFTIQFNMMPISLSLGG